MTNFEEYANKIKLFLSRDVGVSKGYENFISCDDLPCEECKFWDDFGACINAKRRWFEEEYGCTESPVDWTKVVVDTPILVRDNPKNVWERRYFAGFKRGKVYAFTGGRTSWTTPNNGSAMSWKYAKLAK